MPLFLMFPAFVCCLLLPHMKDSKTVLYFNAALLGIYILTMLYNGLPMGTMIYLIALTGTFTQIFFPESRFSNAITARNFRIGSALIVALIGAGYLYSSPIDLLAISGFVVSRLSETIKQKHLLISGYFMSVSLNMLYSLANGIYSLVFFQIVLLASILWALSKGPVLRYLQKMRTSANAV